MDYQNTHFASNKILNTIILSLFFITLSLLLIPFDLFAPELALKIHTYNELLYIALIVEISNFLAIFIMNCVYSAKAKKITKKINQYLESQVQSLDFAERALLREFVLQRKSVLTLPAEEPTVKSLLQSKILVPAYDCANDDDKISVMISKRARPFITYRSIGLTKGKMTEEMIEQIMQARPLFAKEQKPMPKAYRGGLRHAA